MLIHQEYLYFSFHFKKFSVALLIIKFKNIAKFDSKQNTRDLHVKWRKTKNKYYISRH